MCYHHGGKSLSGPASGTHKTGKYSKVLPVRLAQRYHTGLSDPDLLTLRHEIAAMDARLAEAYMRLDTGESGALWRELRRAERILHRALLQDDRDKQVVALDTIRQYISRGATEAQLSIEIRELEDHRRKLVETEQKLLLMKEQTVTVKELQTYLGVVIDTIQRHVGAHSDPEAARAILAGISADFNAYALLEHAGNGAGT